MGVVGTVLTTLGSAYLSGRAQQQQYEAQAAQAQANAEIQARNAEISRQNSEKARQNAEQTARNNAFNAENARRQALLREGQQRARIGASGIQASGSAAAALADTRYAINQNTAASLYSGRQTVDKIFGQATDFTNQAAQYQYNSDVMNANARDYREAGKRAFMSSMLGGAFSLAGSLYTSKSAAAQSAGESAASGGGWGSEGEGWNNVYSKTSLSYGTRGGNVPVGSASPVGYTAWGGRQVKPAWMAYPTGKR